MNSIYGVRTEIIWEIIFPVLIIKRQENDRMLLSVEDSCKQIRRCNASR